MDASLYKNFKQYQIDMHKFKNYKKFNNTTWLNCYSRAPKFNNCLRNA